MSTVTKLWVAIVLFCLNLITFGESITWTLPVDWERSELDSRAGPVGAPNVPYYTARIAVPSRATGLSLTATQEQWSITNLPRPQAVRAPSIIGEPLNEPAENTSLFESTFPSVPFELFNEVEESGTRTLLVRIHTFRWNGANQLVEKLSGLTLTIEYTLPRAVRRAPAANAPTDYLIISPPNYITYWEEFLAYRRTTHPHMTFALVNTDEIYAAYEGADDALKLHHYLKAMYEQGTRYVLLGAGCQKNTYDRNYMIPTRMACIKGDNSQACDYYYCVMDKPSDAAEVWDANGDGVYLASRNSNGSYSADATSQFSWRGRLMVHRFPARNTINMGGKSRTAEQQIRGYVAKLRRAEQGLFPGRFSQAVLGHTQSTAKDVFHGNTHARITQEREFYDLGANIWSRAHGRAIASIECETRERIPTYMTLKRPVSTISGVNQYYYKPDAIEDILTRDYDSLLINSHGSPSLVEPMERGDVWNATGLWRFYIMCVPCHAGHIGPASVQPNDATVSIAEASVANPDGGALICYANSGSGWSAGADTMSLKIERDVVRQLYGFDGTFQDAGTARLYAQNNYGSTPSPNNPNGEVLANSIALGCPLVTLSPIWSRTVTSTGEWGKEGETESSNQEYASTLNVTANGSDLTMALTNDAGAATMNVTGLNGQTLTIAGTKTFKVTNALTVDHGNVTFDVAGGFGRNGITFVNAPGKLKIQGNHKGYYGINFNNVAELEVAGGGATLDFDTANFFRNAPGKMASLKFTGSGTNRLRARGAGLFSTDFTIPVTGGGTVILETPNMGGSGAQDATIPLFAVTNATLAIDANPNWSSEYFSRSVHLVGGVISNAYETFGFGPASGVGYDLWVGGSSRITGTKPIKLNGALRLHPLDATNKLTITGELVNGTAPGSLVLEDGVTVTLAAPNALTGDLVVPSGARVEVDQAQGLGMGNVTVESGATLVLNAMPLEGVKSVSIKNGAKLVLTKQGVSSSYQMYEPTSTSFVVEEGARVSDSENESVPLNGIITAEGAYFISDAAKTYRGGAQDIWSSTNPVAAWLKEGSLVTYADGDTVLFKNTTQAMEIVPCEGVLQPGLVAFQNESTAYSFTGTTAQLNVSSLATTGETIFEPSLNVSSMMSVGGKTTVRHVTTPALNVVGGGALQVMGEVEGVDKIRVIQWNIQSSTGFNNAQERDNPVEISEMRFYYADGSQVYFPAGTRIEDSAGNYAVVSGKNETTGAHTFSETSGGIYKYLDQDTSTYNKIGTNTAGPWWVKITCPVPIAMFATFKYGRGTKHTSSNFIYQMMFGQYADANPQVWTLLCGDNASSLKQVCSRGLGMDNVALSLTNPYTATWSSSSLATVTEGAKLYLSGTYNMCLVVQSGAIFAVTNDHVLTVESACTLPTAPSSIIIDTTEAKRSANFFKVTSGLNLAPEQVTLFTSLDDSIAFKIGTDGDLYVATAGVMQAPYSTTISDSTNWGDAAWMDGHTNAFTQTWREAAQQSQADIYLTITGANKTLNNDCNVWGTTLSLTSASDIGSFTVSGSGSLSVRTIDASSLQGDLVWNQSLNGANFVAGMGTTIITSATNGGKLTVPEGAQVILQDGGLFAEYENQGTIRYAADYGEKPLTNFATGNISIKSATLIGPLQSITRTFHQGEGDTINFRGDLNSRIDASFNMTGGNITLTSNGAATWFGHEGSTTYRQTGGTFTCTANGASFNGTSSGLVLAYDSDGVEPLELQIFGGLFSVPSAPIIFFKPASILVATNGLVRTKGVGSAGEKGTITVTDGGTFELGSLGVATNACTFNLLGGSLVGYEKNAQVQSTINLAGSGTIAATEGTTFTVSGPIEGPGILTIGSTNHTGTVQFDSIPENVDEFCVAGGEWRLGADLPTNKTLRTSAGALALTLSDAQITQAMTNHVEIIRASQVPAGGVKVYSVYGIEQKDTIAEINSNGYLTVQTTHTSNMRTLQDAQWNNTGDNNNPGVLTGANFGQCNFTTMTLNFSTNDNMAVKTIGTNGMVRLKTIRLFQRSSGTVPTMPSRVTVTQGEKSVTGTLRSSTEGIKVHEVNVSNYYTRKPSYILSFDSDELFDTRENVTLTFSSQIGLLVIQPKNSLLQFNNWSPVIQVVGDYIEVVKIEKPSLPEGQGLITQNAKGEWVVEPAAGQTHITVNDAGAFIIVVPPCVTHVTGVAPEKLKVGLNDVDYSGLFTKTGNAQEGVTRTFVSDPMASVTIEGEEIKLMPELTAIEFGEHAVPGPIMVTERSVAVGVKTIPGLLYKLMRSSSPTEWGTTPVVEIRATGSRVKLEDPEKPTIRAFFKVIVEP